MQFAPLVYAGLVVAGIILNAVIARLGADLDELERAVVVAIVTAIGTGTASLLVGTEAAAVVFGCLVALGAPMTVGAFWRERQRKTAESSRLRSTAREELHHEGPGAD